MLLAVWRRPRRSLGAGILLASVWNAVTLLALNVVATRAGWWSFHAQGGTFLSVPIDLYLGWIVLWGAIPLLVLPRLRIEFVLVLFLALDVLGMPLLSPVLQLGRHWHVGEALGILLCLAPSQMLGRWTRDSSHLYARAFLQVIAFSGLTLGMLPAAILARTGGEWMHAMSRPAWMTGLFVQFLAIPALLGLSAVQEFALRGHGTPLPYDPPRKLVTSGPYAYVANPMQLSAVLTLAAWGWFLNSPWVAFAGVMAHIYSAGLAGWDESEDVSKRFGGAWMTYRRNVRKWIPRTRPWHEPVSESEASGARLYVSETCGPCSEVKRWFEKQGARGLLVVAAETRPDLDLRRITYDPGDGSAMEQGVRAIARGLEHIHLAWAFAGWVMRLPILVDFIQLLADASGSGPRTVAYTGAAYFPGTSARTSAHLIATKDGSRSS